MLAGVPASRDRSFLELADDARLPKKTADRERKRIPEPLEDARGLVARSFLLETMKRDDDTLLEERGAMIAK